FVKEFLCKRSIEMPL
ncbi:hypothetical protein N499_1058B, partial [Wolbachia pipientis wVitA]